MTISITMFMKMITTFMILNLMMIIISAILMNFICENSMLLLVMFSTLNLLLMFMKTSQSMYMYMIFISIVGGMMIMFLYFTSMINNYPSKAKVMELFTVVCLMIIMMTAMFLIYYLNQEESWYCQLNKFNLNNTQHIYKIYLYPLNLLTILTIFNLLFCLLLAIKMCSSKYLPLRKINYEKF